MTPAAGIAIVFLCVFALIAAVSYYGRKAIKEFTVKFLRSRVDRDASVG